MSIQTWMTETCTATDLEKWQGLDPVIMAKHGVRFGNNITRIYDIKGNSFLISNTTCQCCHQYLDFDCLDCPLYLKLEQQTCDSYALAKSPWRIFIKDGNPKPMIDLLTSIKDKLPQRSNDVNFYEDRRGNTIKL